ncbi:MAG: hypothetical protein GXP28_00280 [Planctomycetes bacterium]|nr:hypothetical protein [Planctomycetota bacterium]
MSTFHFTAQVDGGMIRLPEDVKLAPGTIEVTVVQTSQVSHPTKSPRTSLADWAEQHAESWGQKLDASDVSGFTGRSF